MGTMRFNFRSQSLANVDVTITFPTDELSYFDTSLLPKSPHPLSRKNRTLYKPGMKFQTVYFIQGGGDDDSLVYRYMNLERYASENMVMLVTPNLPNSYGADTDYGVKNQTFLTEELPVIIQSLFPSSPNREDNFIAGYAMGGNAALATAIMHPELYCHCVDMSGGIGYTMCPETIAKELKSREEKGPNLYSSTFGKADNFVGSKHDLVPYVKRHIENGVEWPKFTVICGSEEFIRHRVEDDVEAMRHFNMPVDYILAEGYDHDFEMWDKYSKIVLDEILPLKRTPIMPE